jgi:hypothetical protein
MFWSMSQAGVGGTSIFGTLQDVEKAMMELYGIRGRKAQLR